MDLWGVEPERMRTGCCCFLMREWGRIEMSTFYFFTSPSSFHLLWCFNLKKNCEREREKSSPSEERMKEKSVSFVGLTIFLKRVKKKTCWQMRVRELSEKKILHSRIEKRANDSLMWWVRKNGREEKLEREFLRQGMVRRVDDERERMFPLFFISLFTSDRPTESPLFPSFHSSLFFTPPSSSSLSYVLTKGYITNVNFFRCLIPIIVAFKKFSSFLCSERERERQK